MFGPTVGIEGKMPSLLGSATGEAGGSVCNWGHFNNQGRFNDRGARRWGVLFRIFSDRC